MIRANHKAGYWTSVAQYYALLYSFIEGKQIDDLVGEFRQQIDIAEISPEELD